MKASARSLPTLTYQVSGIKKTELLVKGNQKLLSDLQAISKLSTDTPLFAAAEDHKEQLNLLRDYIEKKKTIPVEELFTLAVQITDKKRGGKHLNLHKQMESEGTDKVLRIFISLILLKEFFITKPENRITVYIDEVGTIDKENAQRLLNLFTSYHALPIFASTEIREGFGAYYLVTEAGGKSLVSEQTKLAVPNK